MKTKLLLLSTLAGISTLFAQAPGGVFQKFDKNSDGKITTEELPNPQTFTRFDANKDGAITLAEYNQVSSGAAPMPPAAPTPPSPPTPPGTPSTPMPPAAPAPAGGGQIDTMIKNVDKNADGKITSEEAGGAPWFAKIDQNADGVVDAAELERLRGFMGKPAGGTPAPTPPPGTPPVPTPPANAPGASQLEAMIKSVDKNADGKITREEAAGAKWFDRLDQNADGVIDAGELAIVKKVTARGAAGGGAMPNAPSITPEQVAEVTSGPEILKPGEVGIGRMIADVPVTDLAGKPHRLSELKAYKGVVIAMTSATCPVSKRYLPSLAKLEKDLRAQGIVLLLVNPFKSETVEEITAQITEQGIASPYIHDKDKTLAVTLQAATTTEVFLLDATRTVIYRGAIDDQYGINYSLDAPKQRYLHDAIAAFLAGERPEIEATAAPGCELDLGDAAAVAETPVTFHRDVARILQTNCVQCHREGGIAPFALDDIEEVSDRAKVIKRVLLESTMPPWFAAVDQNAKTNPWANDCSLSARDKGDVIAWIDSKDRPLGDPADAPVPRVYPQEWSIGTPDLIIPLSRAYDIQATGFMPYAFDVAETNLTEDKWVTAYEILPSARDVVHHVIVQVHEKGTDTRDRDEGTGGYWAIYVPGNGAHHYPDGFARKIPAGSRVSFQIHYTPSGKATKERLRLGLVFAKAAPQYEVKTVSVANPKIAIPPGAADHVETRIQRVPFDMPVTSFMAHMHIRGKAFKYEVTYPDGKTETLLDIPRYDFNWQLRYDLKQPKLLPGGSTVKITAIYDNSAGNKANPDPGKLVKWGSQTVDEMMIGYFEYFMPVAGAKIAAQ